MKKLRFAARILLPFFVLIGLVSCKNTIDEMDIKGYRYVLSRIDDPDKNQLYLYPYGCFTYKLDFAASGNAVVRTISTWDNEDDETEGTFSIDKTSVTISFPASEKNAGEKIGMPEENITLSYDKRSGSLVGYFNLPPVNSITEELMDMADNEPTRVYGQLSAISRVSE